MYIFSLFWLESGTLLPNYTYFFSFYVLSKRGKGKYLACLLKNTIQLLLVIFQKENTYTTCNRYLYLELKI